jgi:hypothetical protein
MKAFYVDFNAGGSEAHQAEQEHHQKAIISSLVDGAT